VQPEIAVISCGRQNNFGHPHKETLGRLAAANAKIYRTDLSGAITIESDGQSLTVASVLNKN
jgi:competence protein ComEC